MPQFIRIAKSFINLDNVRTVQIDSESPAQVTVTWSAGDFDTYMGAQADNIIRALDTLKAISLALPDAPTEPTSPPTEQPE